MSSRDSKRARHRREESPKKQRDFTVLALVVFLAALLIIGLVAFSELVYRPPAPLDCESGGSPTEGEEESSRVWPLHAVVADAESQAAAAMADETGEPPREAVLLMHGVLGSSAVWQHSLEVAWPKEERQRYQIVIPDLLGHGSSPRPQNIAYSVKQHVDSIVDVLERYVPKGRPLHIVGTSLSGPLAVAVASRLLRSSSSSSNRKKWPLRSVSLVVPAYFPGTDRDRIVGLLRNEKRYLRLENTFYLLTRYVMSPLRFLLLPLSRRTYTNNWPASTHRDRVALHGVKTDAYAMRSSVESLVVRYDIDRGLQTLCEAGVPILFVDASNDWIKRHDPQRRALKSKNYACVTHRVVDGKHKVFVEHPERVVSLLREFIGEQSENESTGYTASSSSVSLRVDEK